MSKPKEIDLGIPNVFQSPPRDTITLSRRHAWKQAHGIVTVYHPLKVPGFDWIARLSLSQVRAETEEAAERAICEKHNIIHFMDELDFQK